jgi:hypothetical protein
LTIDWEAPSGRGSQILGYKIFVRKSDLTYSTETMNCDGSKTTIISSTRCTIPLNTLTAAPFSLSLGNIVFAKVIAYNYYGDSATSQVGSGAVIVLVPDAPINLINDPTITNSFRIGFSWSEGTSNGGAEVIDFSIAYD